MKRKSLILVLVIISILVCCFLIYKNNHDLKIAEQKRIEYVESIKQHYFKYVITNKETNLYDSNKNIIGKINKDVKILLKDKTINNENDDYFELEYFDNNYIFYDDVTPIEEFNNEDEHYKNYVVFNENCVTDKKTSFYDSNFKFMYEVNFSIDAPIYIKEDDFYGVEFNNQIVYLKKDEVNVKESHNTDVENAKSIPVLLYHFFHNHNNFEDMVTVISIRIDKFENQMKYLKDNDFMTLKLKDLELYLKGKVQIKENSVVITIDDGNSSVFDLAYPIIEKYGVNATVFAITSWNENILDKQNEYVEIHSHTHGMHVTGKCAGGQGGLFKCVDYDEGLADLKKSREILNGSTYLAYPFGEYTDLSIQLLKDAGFTMAFTTEWRNAKVGDDLYEVPRIYIYNEYSLDTFKRIVN